MKKKLIRIVATILFAVVLAAVYSRYIEPEMLVVKQITVETSMDIEACRIVFFTDTHFGELYDEKHVKRIVQAINKRDADIVVFGGDLLDNYARDKNVLDMEYLKEELKNITARGGKYAVYGNHDYGGGAVRIYETFMNDSGFRVLDDETVYLEQYRIEITGFDDYLLGWTQEEFYQIPGDRFHLLVSHEPVISRLVQGTGDSFLLSGHTHGGQVYVPYLTRKLLPNGSDQFVKGFYDLRGMGADTGVRMYVSSGIGLTQYPFRLLNVPEIVEVNMITKK